MTCAVALINPKYPRNVAGALRACSNFGADILAWTPERVENPQDWPKLARLPREERMRLYHNLQTETLPRNKIIDRFLNMPEKRTPVAIEVGGSENLADFWHPEHALYVFGPEDGSIPPGILSVCHRFVRIPSRSCLNLAAAVNIVLYDRIVKSGSAFTPHQHYQDHLDSGDVDTAGPVVLG